MSEARLNLRIPLNTVQPYQLMRTSSLRKTNFLKPVSAEVGGGPSFLAFTFPHQGEKGR